MNEIRVSHKNALRLVRAKMGLTQQEFASIIGISQQSYSAKELGKTDVTVSEALRILEVTGEKFEDIFLPADYKNLVVESDRSKVRPVPCDGGGIYFEVDSLRKGESQDA